MSQPTKEQWKKVEQDLDSLFRPVYLKCDEYYVRYALVRMKNKLVIDVYVNGFIKTEWYGDIKNDNPHEEAIRFWRPTTRSKYTAKELKRWEKIQGKRECRKRGMYEKRVFPWPWWNRPRPLIAHLKKHNTDIEIITYETHQAAIEKIEELNDEN